MLLARPSAAAAILLSLSASCSRPADQAVGLVVFVSIPPQAFFVERIGGSRVSTHVLVGPGQEPHTYSPAPRQVAELGRARIFFTVGMPFEDALCAKIGGSGPGPKIVDTREGLALIDGDSCDHEEHGGTHEEHAQEKDPHVWLDPKLARAQAGVICRELCAADPAGRAAYEEGLAGLRKDLDEIDAELAGTLAPFKGRAIYVFHPAYAYFAASYGLRQVAVESGGKSPGPRHISDLIRKAREEGVKVVFAEPQFSSKAAETIAQGIGGVVVPMDPLAKDYIANLRDMAGKIKDALSAGG